MLLNVISLLIIASLAIGLFVLHRRIIRLQEAASEKPTQPLEENQSATMALQSLLIRITNEMRTPLNSIVGLSTVLEDSKLSPQQMENVKMVRLAGDNLLSLIRDIQYYSRVETKSEPSEISNMHLSATLEETIEESRELLVAKPIEVAFLIDPELPAEVRADESHIRQILGNLISNAAKFTRSGEILISVSRDSTSQREKEDKLVFEVKDSGIGISEENLKRIFSATNLETLNQDGYLFGGFELYISKKICELIGGSMTAESKEYEGSSFVFTAPFFKTSSKSHEPNSESLKGQKVLLATASATLGNSLAANLQYQGVEVHLIESEGDLKKLLVSAPDEFHSLIFDAALIGSNLGARSDLTHLLRECQIPTTILTTHDTHRAFSEDPVFSKIQQLSRPILPSRLLESLKCTQIPLKISQSTPNPFSAESVKTGSVTRELESARGALKILIAEDDKVNQKVIKMMINRLGHQADLAEDGMVAVEATSGNEYDIIFMDLNMPNLGGIEATREIFSKYDNVEDRPVVIAITAAVTSTNQRACKEVGMKGFISKPVKLEVLRKALSSVKPRASVAIS